MPKAHVLNPQEYALFKEMAREYGRRVRVPPSRNDPPPGESYQTPDVYIALPPEDGIPPLTRSGTASGPGAGDQPGVADCDIYSIAPDGALQVVGISQQVVNLTTETIEQEFIPIHRNKFGQYWLTGGSSVA